MMEVPRALPATFTAKSARDLGIPARVLYAWRDRGDVYELSRGVFRHADAPEPTFPDFLAAASRAPRAIVCCVSAASAHGLTDEREPSVQIAVPRDRTPPRIAYPPTTAFRFDPATFEMGLGSVEAAPGEPIRIYDPARTVVDLMRLRGRLGESVAYTALNRYLATPGSKPARLLEYARPLDVLGPIRGALDVASAR